jgi:hypothetical protein
MCHKSCQWHAKSLVSTEFDAFASKHSPKGWIGRELIWRRLGGCSIAEHYECFACGTDFS